MGMKKLICILISGIVLTGIVLTSAAPAKADYFVWQDPQSGASLTFPDTWKRLSTRKPDELVRLAGPDTQGQPICRLRARADNRFTVYPVWLSDAVQQFAYSKDFWEEYTGEFDNVQFHSIEDHKGIGKAFASRAVVSYTPVNPDPFIQRTAIMFAGVYFDEAYVFDCSSEVSAFNKWLPLFESIAKSVDMRKTHHELATGDYRDFITNQRVRLENPDGITNTVY